MVIGPVDHRDLNRFTTEFLGRLESAKASAENYNARLRCRHIFHATILQQQDWMKAPNSRPQIPKNSKLQYSTAVATFCSSEFEDWDFFGVWWLGFGASAAALREQNYLSWRRRWVSFAPHAEANITQQNA